MRHMDTSRFSCDFWALLVILTCSCLLRTASGEPRTAVAGQFCGNNANHEKNLAWEQKIDIVQDVTEGLSYLRKESKTRIIHRDRKARNIPLNYKFNSITPNSDQTRGCVPLRTLAGFTSPSLNGHPLHEYLMENAKAEAHVFRFGVLVFEIMTGKRCLVWKLWPEVWYHYNNDTLDAIVDKRIREENRKEYIRHVIYIGLLCTQENSGDRPTMAQVVELLESDHSARSQSLYENLMEAADNPNTDAYHFGLHVIETVIQREHRNLMKVRYHYYANRIEEIVDMRIRMENSDDFIRHVIRIGLSCMETRITMAEVLEQLRERPYN